VTDETWGMEVLLSYHFHSHRTVTVALDRSEFDGTQFVLGWYFVGRQYELGL